MRVSVEKLCYSYEHRRTLTNISLEIPDQQFVGLIGPNGSGKSTLLKNMYRVLIPEQGVVKIDDVALNQLSYKASAKKIATVGQEYDAPFDFRVEEIVMMGRYPCKTMFEGETELDRKIVTHSLRQVEIGHLAKRNFQHLSGGEKQRVLIARALAQKTDLLILDEPTNHLDIRFQLEIFELLHKSSLTVISAIHDLNIAAMYCDCLHVLENGNIIASGSPEDVLTKELLWDVFHVKADIRRHPMTKKVTVTYLPQTFVG